MMKLKVASIIVFIIICIPVKFSVAENQPDILVVHGQADGFSEVVDSLESELDSEITSSEFVVIPMTRVTDFTNRLDRLNPKMVVLIGNHAINLYYEFQQSYPDRKFPPAFMVAALNIDYHATRIKNSIGIRYEVPVATMLVNWRSIASSHIERVGVIHREGLTDLVRRNKNYCKTANIELISYSVPNDNPNIVKVVKDRLAQLKSQKVDALWIVNDGALLSAELLSKAWLPFVRSESLPVVVGIEALASKKINLGTFSVIPSLSALGEQAAAYIFEIEENEWDITGMKIEAPISVKKTLNLRLAKQLGIKLQGTEFDTIDTIIR